VNKERKTIFIDICGTLYSKNTTYDFIDHYNNDSISYRLLNYFFSFRFMILFNMIILNISKFDIKRSLFIWLFLRGKSKFELSLMANNYYESVLKENKIKPTFEELEKYKFESYNLILISATLDFLAEVIANKMNITTFYSSELRYNNNLICSGIIKKDLLGKKINVFRQNNINKSFTTITDNFSDLDIIINSENKIIICKRRKVKRWDQLIFKHKLYNVKKIIIDEL
jgi:phosphoserine phosphatase